jgi:hypothetical protein
MGYCLAWALPGAGRAVPERSASDLPGAGHRGAGHRKGSANRRPPACLAFPAIRPAGHRDAAHWGAVPRGAGLMPGSCHPGRVLPGPVPTRGSRAQPELARPMRRERPEPPVLPGWREPAEPPEYLTQAPRYWGPAGRDAVPWGAVPASAQERAPAWWEPAHSAQPCLPCCCHRRCARDGHRAGGR